MKFQICCHCFAIADTDTTICDSCYSNQLDEFNLNPRSVENDLVFLIVLWLASLTQITEIYLNSEPLRNKLLSTSFFKYLSTSGIKIGHFKVKKVKGQKFDLLIQFEGREFYQTSKKYNTVLQSIPNQLKYIGFEFKTEKMNLEKKEYGIGQIARYYSIFLLGIGQIHLFHRNKDSILSNIDYLVSVDGSFLNCHFDGNIDRNCNCSFESKRLHHKLNIRFNKKQYNQIDIFKNIIGSGNQNNYLGFLSLWSSENSYNDKFFPLVYATNNRRRIFIPNLRLIGNRDKILPGKMMAFNKNSGFSVYNHDQTNFILEFSTIFHEMYPIQNSVDHQCFLIDAKISHKNRRIIFNENSKLVILYQEAGHFFWSVCSSQHILMNRLLIKAEA